MYLCLSIKYLICSFSNDTKITSFHSKTWIKLWQIPQNLLNDHFTNVIIQKVVKTKFVNNYRAYATMKNKIMKMQHDSLYKLTKEWLGDKRLKIKQGSLKKTKLDVSVIAVSKNLTRF